MRRTNTGPCQRSEAGTNDHRGEVPGRTCQRLSMLGAIRLNMKIVIAGSGLFADGSLQSNEFVPGADCFGRQVTPVVGIDRRLERNAGADTIPALMRPSSLAGLLVSSTIRVQFRDRSIIAAVP